MPNSSQQKQETSTELSILEDGLKIFLAPDILPFAAILGVLIFFYAFLTIWTNRSKKHGNLATAREATKAEQKAGVKRLFKKLESPSATNGVLYLCEPIGSEVPAPEDLHRHKGRITPITEINTSTLVVGVPGCGKTANVINPAIKSAIKQGHRIMIFDAKYPEQAEQIASYAIEHGYDISIYAPGYEESATFNILDAVQDEHDSTTADQVVLTLRKNLGSNNQTDSFFETGGQGMVAGAILLAKRAARLSGRPEVANLLLVDEIISMHDLTARLIANRDDISRAAYRSFTQFLSAHSDAATNDTAASLRSTAASIMKPLVSSRFVDSIAGLPDFPCFHEDKPFWIGEKNLVIFGLNQDLKDVVSPLIATAIQQIGNYNLNSTRRSDTPLAIFLDEIPQINVPDVFDLWMPVKRSLGCSIVFGMQYLGQAEETYGEHVIPKILGAGNKFFFNPGSALNAEILSKECGEREVVIGSSSKSRSSGQHSSYSFSDSDQIQSVPLFDPLHFSQLPVGSCIAQLAATKTGKGLNEKVGLPYRIRFDRLDQECRAQEEESRARYQEMVKVAIANKKKRSPEAIDYTATSSQYRHLAEDHLPLPVAESPLESLLNAAIEQGIQSLSVEKKSKTPAKYVSLQSLLLMAEHYGWQLDGDFDDRDIRIPNDWGDITLKNLGDALELAGIEVLTKTGKK